MRRRGFARVKEGMCTLFPKGWKRMVARACLCSTTTVNGAFSKDSIEFLTKKERVVIEYCIKVVNKEKIIRKDIHDKINEI